ncbi:MAG TPA: homoserine kinase [Polyangia bacterium]|jgi:homoserine kinase type II|nr:homoserine kinase [Polyangia bacterium]
MAEWRRLGAADIRAILRDFGLDGYRAHQPIAVGTINTNVRVETDAGPLFLRVNEGKSLDDVGREAAIVAHVAARGVPTPVPLVSTTSQPFVLWQEQIVSLFPWVPGRTLERAELTAGHAAAVGRALANLHRAGADFADRRPGRYEPEEIERRLAGLRGLARPELAPAVTILTVELGALLRERTPSLPTGLIHGDLFVDNVLFAGDALAALLDFEQASWGRLGYDLAVTVLAFGFGRDDFCPEVTRGLLDAYVAARPPTPEERSGFGAELRFAACRFAVTRITDVHLKQGAGAAPGKRYQRYLARLASVHAHLGAADGLLSL